MPQFEATIKHIKEGVKGFTVGAAVKNIEGWETTLEKVEGAGAKAIVKDLENLKTHLTAEPIDGDAVKKLVAKLAKETIAISSHANGRSQQVKQLGEALNMAVEKAA